MKKQRISKGAILEICIDKQYYVYAQILEKASYAFFDYRSKKQLKDFSILLNSPILFIVSVYDDVITEGHWIKVGKLSIRNDLLPLPMKFIQDVLDINIVELYDPNTGEIFLATKNDCLGLERSAVWEAEHVESRISDFYNGKKNIWVEQLKMK
ncbi:hypothetical protein JGH11_18540 [Dysgonomonas sp. Marseille-P4677]|uniref:Imm26 family immunity protein n=1 Tax=Dysgonomonas sp. Marseille-P4677 TaxID=2364790 RepID=UPI001911A619|nr:Imm26 family immunity protein [Dysgonomonas sp. Marseille-P4677]MBK5722872.1 hypothetical protein [Dysgonomonas sp. Marseille-P4677]